MTVSAKDAHGPARSNESLSAKLQSIRLADANEKAADKQQPQVELSAARRVVMKGPAAAEAKEEGCGCG
jgi:hypothetical protein